MCSRKSASRQITVAESSPHVRQLQTVMCKHSTSFAGLGALEACWLVILAAADASERIARARPTSPQPVLLKRASRGFHSNETRPGLQRDGTPLERMPPEPRSKWSRSEIATIPILVSLCHNVDKTGCR